MPVRVAINGFGRVGRSVVHAAHDRGADLEFVAVNDLTDSATLAHLLAYDSVFGRFPGEVRADDGKITVDGHEIRAFSETDPSALPWADLDVDVVIESTGKLRTRAAAAAHLDAGARKVIISAPARATSPRTRRWCSGSTSTRSTTLTATTSSPTRRARRTAWRRPPRCCTRPWASGMA